MIPRIEDASTSSGPTGVYPAWTLTPEDAAVQNHTGTIDFDVVGLPDATYSVNRSEADVDLDAGSVDVPFTLISGAPQVVPAYTG
jgi:hypothetical protein